MLFLFNVQLRNKYDDDDDEYFNLYTSGYLRPTVIPYVSEYFYSFVENIGDYLTSFMQWITFSSAKRTVQFTVKDFQRLCPQNAERCVDYFNAQCELRSVVRYECTSACIGFSYIQLMLLIDNTIIISCVRIIDGVK